MGKSASVNQLGFLWRMFAKGGGRHEEIANHLHSCITILSESSPTPHVDRWSTPQVLCLSELVPLSSEPDAMPPASNLNVASDEFVSVSSL